jgi:hypothetical protein
MKLLHNLVVDGGHHENLFSKPLFKGDRLNELPVAKHQNLL